MPVQQIHSFAAGRWVAPGAGARPVASAITGEIIASAGNDALDVPEMLTWARATGGPAVSLRPARHRPPRA